ncbi:MAG: hypothetical protein ACRCXE_01450, partial [Metamycoplasmataceae bacterium]
DVKNIKGIKELTKAWKNFEIEVKQRDLVNGKISGTFVGRLRIMSITKKITMNDLFEKMESMDKKIESIDKGLQVVNKKIDLILATPTMKKEIDHEALSKLNQLS